MLDTARHHEERRYLSAPELARRWGVSTAHTYRLIARGVLPSLRAGCTVRVPLDAIEAYERAGGDQ